MATHFRQAEILVDKLHKVQSSALPIEQPTKFEFDNLKTAKALGRNDPAVVYCVRMR